MTKLNIQFFGGRGASYLPPTGSNNGNWATSVGTRIAETLKEAIGKKGKSMEMKEAYEGANPNFDRSLLPYSEYTENCQRCVVAYELRRRGYNVTAQPTYQGDTLPISMVRGNVKWGRWQGAFKGARPESVGGKTSDKVYDNIMAKMNKYGNGSRAVVSITYKGQRIGHVFNIENRKGTIMAVDAQSGERIRLRQFLKITENSRTTIVRTDNLRVSDRAKNMVTTEYARKRKR